MDNERLVKSKSRLEMYYAAEEAVLTGQEYKIGSRSLKRADLTEIRKTIEYLENLVSELNSKLAGNGKRKAYRITPRDL